MTASSRRPGLSTLALAAAGAVAVAAVGVAVWRGTAGPDAPANSRAADVPVGNVGDMISRLEAKMKGSPDDADGWRMLGWSYFETGRYADSAGAYAKAAAIDPDKAEYWSALGEATVLAEKGAAVSPKAEQAFRRAVAVDAKDPRARYFLAIKKDMDGDHRGAVDDWIALLKDSPSGSPWEADVRKLVQKVATDHKLDIAGRLPPPSPAAAALAPGAAPPSAMPGSPAAVATDAIPGPTRDQMMAASQLPAAQQDAMVRGMVDGLAAKLKARPKDADGWIRLMRARMVLNDRARAGEALAAGRAAFSDDPAQQARLAEAARALGVPGA